MTRITTRRLPTGAAARLDIPADRGLMFTVGAVAPTKAEALAKAARIAEHLAADPILRAVMPPGTASAVLATRQMAQAASAGLPALRALWRRFRGPGKRRVLSVLAQERANIAPQEVGEVGVNWAGLATAAGGMAGGPAGAAAAGLGVKAAQEIARRRAEKKRKARELRERRAKLKAARRAKAMRDAKRRADVQAAKRKAAAAEAAAAAAAAAAARPRMPEPEGDAYPADDGYENPEDGYADDAPDEVME